MTEPLAWTIKTQQSATSTSDLAKQAALNGAPSGSSFLAIEQTAGRGRQGRYWSSKKGGMYLSVLLRPTVERQKWFAMSFAASLSALDTVREQLAPHLANDTMLQNGLKWPNDVLLAGGKVAGILLEAEGQTLIVGVGINIAPVEAIAPQATDPAALADIWPAKAGDLPSPYELANCLLKHLAYWYGQFDQFGFTSIRTAWLANALFFGKRLSVKFDAKEITGIFHDLGMDGTLLLLDDLGKTYHITTGEVKLLGD